MLDQKLKDLEGTAAKGAGAPRLRNSRRARSISQSSNAYTDRGALPGIDQNFLRLSQVAPRPRDRSAR